MDIIQYLTYDLPIFYRNIKLYPVTVKDYFTFTTFSQCFTLDKNSIPDPKILTMTELEYLYYLFENGGKENPYIMWFDRVLSLCLKDDNTFESIEKSMNKYKRDEKGRPFFIIGEEKYTAKDFEDLKNIICQQNLVELPDENVSKEVRDAMENAKEYKRKLAGEKPASLEECIISLSVVSGWNLEYIYSMSIRKFKKSLKRLDNYIHYRIYLTATMSGMVEFKDKSFIKNWLSDLDDEDKYGDVSINLTTIQNKISLESAKKK